MMKMLVAGCTFWILAASPHHTNSIFNGQAPAANAPATGHCSSEQVGRIVSDTNAPDLSHLVSVTARAGRSLVFAGAVTIEGECAGTIRKANAGLYLLEDGRRAIASSGGIISVTTDPRDGGPFVTGTAPPDALAAYRQFGDLIDTAYLGIGRTPNRSSTQYAGVWRRNALNKIIAFNPNSEEDIATPSILLVTNEIVTGISLLPHIDTNAGTLYVTTRVNDHTVRVLHFSWNGI